MPKWWFLHNRLQPALWLPMSMPQKLPWNLLPKRSKHQDNMSRNVCMMGTGVMQFLLFFYTCTILFDIQSKLSLNSPFSKMADPTSCVSWVSCDPQNNVLRVTCQPQDPSNVNGVSHRMVLRYIIIHEVGGKVSSFIANIIHNFVPSDPHGIPPSSKNVRQSIWIRRLPLQLWPSSRALTPPDVFVIH